MHTKSTAANNKSVKPGIYEIQSSEAGLFLDSVDGPVYNGWCDDALVLKKRPSRLGKWEIARVGDGYTIKQIATNSFCALADGEEFLYQSVVLSSVPTIWSVEYIEEATERVRILWSVSDISWEAVPSNEEYAVVMGRPPNNDLKTRETFNWFLQSVGGPNVSGKLKPGLYSIQNKVAETYVMMGPNEKTIGCWPVHTFRAAETKLWEVSPLGDGYSIRLHGTDKYCTLEEGMQRGSSVNVSTFPAAWRIIPNESAVHGSDDYFQIFWGNTNMTWDLSNYGKATPGNPVKMQCQTTSDYQPCRLFKFIA